MKCSTTVVFPAVGDYCWAPNEQNPERIVLGLPIGTVRLRIVRGPDPGETPDGPVWGWDGDLERPTLTPSINSEGGPGPWYKWHGYLRAGELVTA